MNLYQPENTTCGSISPVWNSGTQIDENTSIPNVDKALSIIRTANKIIDMKDARLARLEKINFCLWVALGASLSYIIMGWL